MIQCVASQHSSFQFSCFTVIPFSASLVFCFFYSLWNETLLSAWAVIGFHVNWDWSGDQQITSACFSSFSQIHTQVHTHTLTLSVYTHTFNWARLDCCHGSLPNEGWDDSWNSDIIMHHSRGPRKRFHLESEKKNAWLLCVQERRLNGPKSALIWCLIFLTPKA